MSYESVKDEAYKRLTYSGFGGVGQASYDQATATRGVGLAILALAEALRPEPTRVALTVNTDEVKAAVVDALEGQR